VTDVKIVQGNILNDKSSLIVCPVNCVGVMGAGLAKQFREQIPECFDAYCKLIKDIQKEGHASWQNVCFLATKEHWKNPSKKSFILKNLKNLGQFLRRLKGYYMDKASIAFPMLGCGCGQLDKEDMFYEMITMFDTDINFDGWTITIYK
jgi:O-acetyl-ADP-ribose deacetylase (regulator of RNase III)